MTAKTHTSKAIRQRHNRPDDIDETRDEFLARYTADRIRRALQIEGGHLLIGHAGNILHYADGATLHGYDDEGMRAAYIAAGLPVIDIRAVPRTRELSAVIIDGPMTAVGRPACPPPWSYPSYAPLSHVAESYRAAGAEIVNLPV